jgi:hypothetical protein
MYLLCCITTIKSALCHLTFCITYRHQKQEREKPENLQAQNVSVNSLDHKSGISRTSLPISFIYLALQVSKVPLREFKIIR